MMGASLPEPPRPTFLLDLLFPGLERKLADALGELCHMAAKEANLIIFQIHSQHTSSFMNSFHNLDLLFRQPIKLVDQGFYLLVSGFNLAREASTKVYFIELHRAKRFA
jgi:hypothetical protein